jgi:fumarylacetoacetase
MSLELNHTHNSLARSWVGSANHPASDFPLQNLPFGVFRRRSTQEPFRGGVAIGNQILDLAALARSGVLTGLAGQAAVTCAAPTLNGFLAMGQPAWRALRHGLFELLHERMVPGTAQEDVERCLVAQQEAEYAVPLDIGDYSDFYTSIHHAQNIGRMFGITTEGSNFEWIPIAYHGRVSSIGVSGQKFRRPAGQIKRRDATVPTRRLSEKLDYEVELGIYIGVGNELGRSIAIDAADQHVFGIGLLNDWSARDIQAWEMHPLGPFLAKNFATTLSPWIVTMEALIPFRVPLKRPVGAPQPLPYLESGRNWAAGAIDIRLEAWIDTKKGRAQGTALTRLSQTSFRHQYWTIAQMIAHHTVNGCNLRTGDLLGSGTISGPEVDEAGALMELAQNGTRPVHLNTGEERCFVEDGDSIILRGFCERMGFARIGFGESRSEVLSAFERSY